MLWNLKSSLPPSTPGHRLKEIANLLLQNRQVGDSQLDGFLSPPFPDYQQVINSVDLDQNQLNQSLSLLNQSIKNNRPILIYGDYDCDGVCAAAILYQALRQKTASVSVFIPHRLEHGYGLSQKGLTTALVGLNQPLVITVDNGITATDQVGRLRSQGLDVIVTDHHVPAESAGKSSLPPATCLVHTEQLSGSGVAWLLGSALLEQTLPLDLATLGTVCDLLPLTGINRALVKHGLAQLSRPTRSGLHALYQVAGIPYKTNLSTYHLGFVLGPRINAIGRLGHALDAFKLLTTTDTKQALSLAQSLSLVNQDRQDLTADLSQIALDHFSSLPQLPKVLFLADERFHEGIIGLIASKLAERFHRPAIIASFSDNLVKASARSVPGFDITSFLHTAQRLLLSLGGHHQAAGFTLDPEQLSLFQDHLQQSDHLVSNELLIKKLSIDLHLSLEDLNFDLLNLLDQLSPFGVGNPIPVFSADLRIKEVRNLGRDKKHLKLILNPPHQHLDVVGFNLAHLLPQISPQSTAKAAFTFQKNTYQNLTKPQLVLKDIRLE